MLVGIAGLIFTYFNKKFFSNQIRSWIKWLRVTFCFRAKLTPILDSTCLKVMWVHGDQEDVPIEKLHWIVRFNFGVCVVHHGTGPSSTKLPSTPRPMLNNFWNYPCIKSINDADMFVIEELNSKKINMQTCSKRFHADWLQGSRVSPELIRPNTAQLYSKYYF